MKYTIQPYGTTGDLIEAGLARMFSEDQNGRRTDQGDYKNALLPGGSRSHRVRYDSDKRRYNIVIDQKALNRIVYALNLTDSKTEKLIETANLNNEFDPFFNHPDLVLEVPNRGLTLDDQTPWGEFWMFAAKSEPLMFNINGTTENPIIRKNQEFVVTTAGHDKKEVDTAQLEGERATGIYHAIKDDFKRLLQNCRAMDIVVDDSSDIEMMRTALYRKITIDKDMKTRDGVRNIERFLQNNDMKQAEFALRATVTEAIGLGIIAKEGRKLVFDDIVLGTNAQQAFDFLSQKKHEDMKGMLLARVKSKTSVAAVTA